AHRLRTHAFDPGELGGRRRAVLEQRADDGHLRGAVLGVPGLGPQSAGEARRGRPQCGGDVVDLGHGPSVTLIQGDCAVRLYKSHSVVAKAGSSSARESWIHGPAGSSTIPVRPSSPWKP